MSEWRPFELPPNPDVDALLVRTIDHLCQTMLSRVDPSTAIGQDLAMLAQLTCAKEI